jgi:hypothetical protein
MQRLSSEMWGFMGLLLLLIGVHLIVGIMQDGHVLASAYQSDSTHDRSPAYAGRSADLIDDAQELDDNLPGPDAGEGRPQSPGSGLQVVGPFMPGPFQPLSGPFRPPGSLQ